MDQKQLIGARIRTFREAQGLTREALAALTEGLKAQSIYRYESGARAPDAIDLIELGKALGIAPGLLLETAEYDPMPHTSTVNEATSVQLIPVLGEVPAGVPMDRALSRYAEEHISVDLASFTRGDILFALRVHGASMRGAGILHGDYAVCSMMATFDVGDVVAVYQTGSGESTIKQLSAWDRKRHRMLLTPHNLDFQPFTVDLGQDDQVRRVQAVVRRYPVRP